MSLFTFDEMEIPGWKKYQPDSEGPNEWKTYDLKSVPVPELNVYNMGKGIHGTWTAPRGWNNYQKTGNFKGCRPIIKPNARININAFETINYVMV